MTIKYLLETCYKCGKEPSMFYDSNEYDALYNIKCCNIHIRDYRTISFIKWNKTMKNYKKEMQEVLVSESVTCDICDKDYEDIMELQEFHYIRFTGGYSSVFGDMDTVECDICQHCLYKMIKDNYRIGE